MRVAVVSDIHGNQTAFEAVVADLKLTAPDLVLHGGDLAHGGSSPAEIIDRIRALGWEGVLGNTDEMLFRPEALSAFAETKPTMRPLFEAIREVADWTVNALGAERLTWLQTLPRRQLLADFALVHASPESLWVSPGIQASETEFQQTYRPLGRPIVAYAHIHHPFVRKVGGIVIANTGSVSLSYDGNPSASYLLLDYDRPSIRRVNYDVEEESSALRTSGVPHAAWASEMLRTACFRMP